MRPQLTGEDRNSGVGWNVARGAFAPAMPCWGDLAGDEERGGVAETGTQLVRAGSEAFGLAIAEFALGFAGLAVSVAPLLPVIQGYTAYAYRVFRGKTPETQGY